MRILSLTFFALLILLGCSKSVEELKQDSDRFFDQALDYYDRGYYTQATDLFLKVIDMENKIGNEQRKVNCYIYLGLISYQISDFKKAENYYKEALKIVRIINDKKNELLVLNNIAGIHSVLGEYDEAIKIYSDVIGKSLIFADKEAEAIASLNLGELYQELWDFDNAFEYFGKAFEAYEIIGDVRGKIFTLNRIGELFITSENFPSALKSFDMVFEIVNKTGSKYLIQEIYNNLGLIYFYQNQLSKAKEFFELAFNSTKPAETNQHILISLKNNLGDCEYRNQVYSQALEYYKEALELSEQSFLKFLSPIIQLKIAKSYEQLYLINGQENDKKSAERYFQFAISRFEENEDWKNLQKALTSIASFYYKIDNENNSLEHFESIKKLKFQIDLKPDDHLKTFAIKPDYDFSFLPSLIAHNKTEDALKLIEHFKFQNALEYFLRFRNFNFLNQDQAKKFDDLQRTILYLNTYQRILTQEISLPAPQRIREKVKIASNKFKESKKAIDEILRSIFDGNEFFEFLVSDKKVINKLINKEKIYIELFPTENNLVCFFVSGYGITSKVLRLDTENLKFNLQILSKNLSTFSNGELKEFSGLNFSQIADEIISEIYSNHSDVKEIIFLLSQSEIDFLPHLFYSKKYNQYIVDKFDIYYSYFMNNNKLDKVIKSIGLLKNGQVQLISELRQSLKDQKSSKLPNTRRDIQQKVRIGLREEMIKNEYPAESNQIKDLDGVIILDELILNFSSPELNYFESQFKNQKTKLSLRELLSYRPDFILMETLKLDELRNLSLILSMFSFSKIDLIIFPLSKSSQEIPNNFLYNYFESVENKKLSLASEEFFKLFRSETNKKYNPRFNWLKFIN